MPSQAVPCDPYDKERLISRIENRCRTNANGCWIWQGTLNAGDTGTIRVYDMTIRVDRVAYWVYVGVIPRFYRPEHTCGESRCCNPKHMQLIVAPCNDTNLAMSALTEEEKAAIRQSKETTAQIMKQYGIGKRHVQKIRRTTE